MSHLDRQGVPDLQPFRRGRGRRSAIAGRLAIHGDQRGFRLGANPAILLQRRMLGLEGADGFLQPRRAIGPFPIARAGQFRMQPLQVGRAEMAEPDQLVLCLRADLELVEARLVDLEVVLEIAERAGSRAELLAVHRHGSPHDAVQRTLRPFHIVDLVVGGAHRACPSGVLMADE